MLQVADAPRLISSCAGTATRYRVVLSGPARRPLNGLVADGALRRGCVVRLLDYVYTCIQNQR
jgi:replication factor A1